VREKNGCPFASRSASSAAEKDPLPVMLVKWSWDEVKRFFQHEWQTIGRRNERC
jgi:hypothetical protein